MVFENKGLVRWREHCITLLVNVVDPRLAVRETNTKGEEMTFGLNLLRSLLGAALLASTGAASAAGVLDLTTKAASGVINGATYTQMAQQPTGTGYIDPFVRVGMQGSAGKDVVQAYNTTVNGVLNNSNEDTWNHEVQFGEFQLVTVGGSSYVRFLLDINQTSANPKLNLDDVQVFVSTAPNQSTAGFSGTGQLSLSNSWLVYRMDGTTGADGNTVRLDYSLNSGSGSGDLYLDIPVAMFTAAFGSAGNTFNTTTKQNNAYVYLYSKFGSDPFTNNDGFEEWAFLSKTPDGGGFSGVPEPSSLLLAGIGLLALRGAGRKGRRSAA